MVNLWLSIWLVVFRHPSDKYEWESVGIMKFPTEWENKIHVPNRQPDYVLATQMFVEGSAELLSGKPQAPFENEIPSSWLIIIPNI